MTRQKMMALAAVPVAAVLAGGGVAIAQTAGAPAGAAVVQQAGVHHTEDHYPGKVTRTTPGSSATWLSARHDDDHGYCDDDHGYRHDDHGYRHGEHTDHRPGSTVGHAHHGDDYWDD